MWHCPTVGKKEKKELLFQNAIKNLKRFNVIEAKEYHFAFTSEINELIILSNYT